VSTIDDFEANRKLYFGYNTSNERLWKRNESTIISINASDLPSVETLYLHGGNPWPLVEIETVETQAQTSGSVTQTTTTTWHIYGMNGLVATHTNDKTIEFPLTDHLGSPRVVLKQDIVNGSVTKLKEVGTYSWHPFGGILQTLGNGEPHYGFTGQEKDYESDLHNFRARQYSDNLGRFFAVDPQGQYYSPYVYGGNNPFSYTDPDGEIAFLVPILVSAAIGAGTSAAVYTATSLPFGKFRLDNLGKSMLYGAVGGAISGGFSMIGTQLGAFGQSAAFNILSNTASNVGTNLAFGDEITLGSMVGSTIGGAIGGEFGAFKGIKGAGSITNIAGEIGYSAFKGAYVGSISAMIGAGIDQKDMGDALV